MYGNIYTLSSAGLSVSTLQPMLQLKAGAAAPCKILRVVVSARGVTASAMQTIGIARMSAAATVTAAILGTSLFDDTGGNVAAACTLATNGTGINASTTGTVGDKIYTDDFNVLQGWEKIFTPLEQIVVPGAGIIAVYCPVAPGSATTFDTTLTFQELG